MTNDCNHLIGLNYIPYEGCEPVYEIDSLRRLDEDEDGDRFTFCPRCGKRLRKEPETGETFMRLEMGAQHES